MIRIIKSLSKWWQRKRKYIVVYVLKSKKFVTNNFNIVKLEYKLIELIIYFVQTLAKCNIKNLIYIFVLFDVAIILDPNEI